jgi:hypothetical protein
MIRLPKSYLQEITNTLILANTPKSLLNGLLQTKGVEVIRRECDGSDLLDYYQRITAKGSRTPFIIALAYATLVALLTKSPPPTPPPDASFLQWGQTIEQLIRDGFGTTQRSVIIQESPRPSIIYTSGAPSVMGDSDRRSDKILLNL